MARSPAALSVRGRRSRAEILDAAVQVFGEAGEAQTSLAEVARRCGRTSQAIYRYFPDRRALFEAAVLQEDERFAGEMETRLAGVRFPFLSHAQWPVTLEILPRYPLMLGIYRSGNPVDLDLLLASPRASATVARIAAELALGQRAGVIRPDIEVESIATAMYRISVQVLLPRALATHPRSEDVAAVEQILMATIFSPLPDLSTPERRQAFGVELRAALDRVAAD